VTSMNNTLDNDVIVTVLIGPVLNLHESLIFAHVLNTCIDINVQVSKKIF